MTDNTTVFVVDDDTGVRESLAALVESVNLAVRTFSNAHDFLDDHDSAVPGCIVLDLRMPDVNGLQLQQELSSRGTHQPIIFITGYGEVSTAVRAIKNGALNFIEKPFSPQDILDQIYAAIDLDKRLRLHRERRSEISAQLATLTPREKAIVNMVVVGKSTKEVAAELGISPKTVDNHRAKIMRKTRAKSVAELVSMVLMLRCRQRGTECFVS